MLSSECSPSEVIVVLLTVSNFPMKEKFFICKSLKFLRFNLFCSGFGAYLKVIVWRNSDQMNEFEFFLPCFEVSSELEIFDSLGDTLDFLDSIFKTIRIN